MKWCCSCFGSARAQPFATGFSGGASVTSNAEDPSWQDILAASCGDLTGKVQTFSVIQSQKDLGKTAFAEKKVQHLGAHIGLGESSVGIACRKGSKQESLNQDAYLALEVLRNLPNEVNEYSIYVVAGGAGKDGHVVSEFAKDHIAKLIVQDDRFRTCELPSACRDAFAKTQATLRTHARSGTSCVVVVHDHRQASLTVAHVGLDAVCLMKRSQGSNSFEVNLLTDDHSWSSRLRRYDIGTFSQDCVRTGKSIGHYLGLASTHFLGYCCQIDEHWECCGLTCQPDIVEVALDCEEYCLLICSDGIWDVLGIQEASQIVCSWPKEETQQAAEHLVQEACVRWLNQENFNFVDDITVVLAWLPVQRSLVVLLCAQPGEADKIRCVSIAGDELAVLSVCLDTIVSEFRTELARELQRPEHILRLILPDGMLLKEEADHTPIYAQCLGCDHSTSI